MGCLWVYAVHMDEARYNELIANTWNTLVRGLDSCDPDDADVVMTGDMITITFGNGHKCVINTQRAVRQVWVAAREQGIHFDWDDKTKRWIDDKKRGFELYSLIKEIVRAEINTDVQF